MSGLKLCVICQRPLDDGRKRRADAVTCGASCRTLLWRARRKIRRDGGVPYVDVNSDGYGSVASFQPPASRPWSQSDERFYSQAALQDQAGIEITRAERDWMRRNVGTMHPAVQQRLLDRAIEQQRCEAAEMSQHNPIKVEVPQRPSLSREYGQTRPGIEASQPARRPVRKHPYTGPPARANTVSRCSRSRDDQRTMGTQYSTVSDRLVGHDQHPDHVQVRIMSRSVTPRQGSRIDIGMATADSGAMTCCNSMPESIE